jgi:hypothetical protein
MPITKSLRPYYVLGTVIVVLLAVAAGAGLVVPDLYKGYLTPGLITFQFIQDSVTLLVALGMIPAMIATSRGSLRGLVLWAGLLVFVPYYYAFFAFGLTYNFCYPLYLALVGLGAWSLAGLLTGVDLPAFTRHIEPRMPVRFIAIVLAMPLLLAPLWIAIMTKSIATRQIEPTALVLPLDLCFLIPACAYAAVQVWRHRPIGYLLSGVLLVKATISGILLGMGELQKFVLGQGMAVEQFAMWLFLSVAGLIALVLYLRHLGAAVHTPSEAVPSGRPGTADAA